MWCAEKSLKLPLKTPLNSLFISQLLDQIRDKTTYCYHGLSFSCPSPATLHCRTGVSLGATTASAMVSPRPLVLVLQLKTLWNCHLFSEIYIYSHLRSKALSVLHHFCSNLKVCGKHSSWLMFGMVLFPSFTEDGIRNQGVAYLHGSRWFNLSWDYSHLKAWVRLENPLPSYNSCWQVSVLPWQLTRGFSSHHMGLSKGLLTHSNLLPQRMWWKW